MADAQTPVLTGEFVTFYRGKWYALSPLDCGIKHGDLTAAQAPAQPAEPVAWAATSDAGEVEALGMNQSRRFDTPLYFAAPSKPDRAVMQQALDALQTLHSMQSEWHADFPEHVGDKEAPAMQAASAAIAALSATMEKPHGN